MDANAVAAFKSRVENRPVLKSDPLVKEILKYGKTITYLDLKNILFLPASERSQYSNKMVYKHFKAHHFRKDFEKLSDLKQTELMYDYDLMPRRSISKN